MADGDRPTKRLSDSTRVEAFSDGVFAIAATLLVLELAVPTVRDGFAAALTDEWAAYIAFVAAFANIGVLWMGHHTAFSRIVAADSGLLWRNLVLLLTVAVTPFPTAVIASAYRVGSTADQSVAVISYAIVGMGWGLALLLLFGYLGSHRYLVDPSTPPHFFRLTEGCLHARRLRGGRRHRLVRPVGRARDLPRVPGLLRDPRPGRRVATRRRVPGHRYP